MRRGPALLWRGRGGLANLFRTRPLWHKATRAIGGGGAYRDMHAIMPCIVFLPSANQLYGKAINFICDDPGCSATPYTSARASVSDIRVVVYSMRDHAPRSRACYLIGRQTLSSGLANQIFGTNGGEEHSSFGGRCGKLWATLISATAHVSVFRAFLTSGARPDAAS